MTQTLRGRTVVVAGSTSAAGAAVVSALSKAGARVVAVDILEDRVRELAAAHENVTGYTCNLADMASVNELAESVRSELGPADGLIHLVGGWRGGEGIKGQSDEDWDFLHTGIMTTLRNTSRAFLDDLVASPVGRLAIVSAESVASPTADGAAYTAVKSAAEAWTLAVADGIRRAHGEASTDPLTSAALVFVVKALLDERMKAAQPERKFPGFTHVDVLAESVLGIFGTAAEELNGRRIRPGSSSPATAADALAGAR
ncbi:MULTISPECIES: SDR family oxidoreductase [Arthrobacter]|uniref:SDR family oxidoreductase n=1 Tax=Arthrobacter terricola TaxID=2547396 RepID=A0A4R5K580_9MICC|nr:MULTISPECIES: SDR family oxidoreductase [Arthrobacter]MBT8163666.1 SDR family oxidoreductase [Arthrobacter sp. GN70]TDF87881.1 SDR family oxidoreductase [Arthrobacter terricola]